MGTKLSLAHLPTPLEPLSALGQTYGVDLWIKRDDATGGAEAGNKIRKLEYLLAEAKARGATRLITCGGIQSNHCRATALSAARCGMKATLFLRDKTLEGDVPEEGLPLGETELVGNLLLDRLCGAEVHRITAEQYGRRDAILTAAATRSKAAGERPYVVPEGGSNGLGALGYVEAMAEVKGQLDERGDPPFDAVVHACGSGGTAAGVILGAGSFRVAEAVHVMAVCDDATTFTRRIEKLMTEAKTLAPEWGHRLDGAGPWTVDDRFKGPAYAVSTEAQRQTMRDVAQKAGIVLDPVYSGKAFHGLASLCRSGELTGRVLFIHTGGLPGLLAQAPSFAKMLQRHDGRPLSS